jgi:hypothetical protein
MEKRLLLLIITACFSQYGFTQNPGIRNQRSLTDPVTGSAIECQTENTILSNYNTVKEPLTPGLNWQATDGLSIDNLAKVSSKTGNTIAAWGLNTQRISLYGNSDVPVWEVPFTILGWDEVIDMTEDGSFIANGVNDQVQVYTPGSSVPTWSATISQFARGIQIRNDGQQVFVAAVNLATQDSSFVYCFNVGQISPVWVRSFVGNYTALVLSKSSNRLLLGEYGGGNNKLFVLNPATGELIYQTVFADQYPPAVSDDGRYIVSGDFSSHVFLLEYNDSTASYFQKWNYTLNGTNSWATGMGISGDGSTIAIGTLIFTNSGGFDGELYVFNNYSPVPLWIYPHLGDMVQCVDLSSDGSIIAAAGWGPVNNSAPDLLLFRKQSSIPYLTFSSPGSNFCLDLSADGKLCTAGGKAVHARLLGSGGKLFNINSDLGGGSLAGLVIKSGSNQQAGIKVEIIGLDSYFTFSDDSSAYTLKYIPEGTYTATYSAVGYITQNISGIQITAGQITNQDITLLPAGDPPIDLTATQGAALNVVLDWQASPSTGITGYNIYRKQYAFDFYPPTPLGTVGAEDTTYTDYTALPMIRYYYVVTAALQDNLQTPYSNDAEGWIATGFISDELSVWVGSAPVVDGVISPGEWNDAFKADISNFLGRGDNLPRPVRSVTAWFKVNPDKTLLYVAVDNTFDTILEDHDEIAFYIDDNHDGLYPAPGDSTEGNYWAAHYTSGDVIKFRPIYNNGGVGLTFYLPDPQIKVSDASGHPVYEFAIPLGKDLNWQIGFNEQDQSGIFIFALDDPSSYDGWWPCLNQNIFTAEGYGAITFGATDGVPPPPGNLILDNPVPRNIMLQWDQPDITDFEQFNIYWSTDGGLNFSILDSTVGVQCFLTAPFNGIYVFYVTTVDRAGHESSPSNMVQTDVNTGIADPGEENAIRKIKIGPNPFDRQLNIDFTIVKQTQLAIRIIDIRGNLVNQLYNGQIGDGAYHVGWPGNSSAGNDLQPGTYVLQFYPSNASPVSFKIVKK